MGDLEDFENDIKDLLDNLEQQIDSIGKKDASQKSKIISKCQGQCSEISTRIESYDLEILYLDKVKAVPYKEKLKAIQLRFARLQRELDSRRTEGASANTLLSNDSFQRGDGMSSVELIQLGRETQQKGTESLQRTLAMVNASNDMADDINKELLKQIDQLSNAQNMVNDTKSDMTRAKELIKYFGAELVKDKLIMIMIILIVLVIMTVVVIKITDQFTGDTPSSENVPADLILKSYSATTTPAVAEAMNAVRKKMSTFL